MAVRKDTIWESFLAPVVRLFIDEEALHQLYESIDWQQESDRLRNPRLSYPSYYMSQNFHGIESGYLNPSAVVSYDPITQYALPPNETWIRQSAINSIRCQPQRILDLGCGTGSTTLMLKQAFPQAEIVGLDLSPYMLVMANHKAKTAQFDIQLHHSKAEDTGFSNASFDLVTASLLFHEIPPVVSQSILQESFRLLRVGGEVVVLDGNQKTLRHTDWLNQIFEEQYIESFAAGGVDAWMGKAGFEDVQTQDVWWVYQVTRGVKPISVEASQVVEDRERKAVADSLLDGQDLAEFPMPAFSASA